MRASLSDLPEVNVSESRTLTPGIIDIWYFFCEAIQDVELSAEYEALMPPDELARSERLHFERDRRLFVSTRALVRTVLSSYAPVAPADWRFTADDSGKPRIDSPAVEPIVHFSLSNTPGLVVCAASLSHRLVGVDAERNDRNVDFLGVAEHFFSSCELGTLRSLTAGELQRRFFEYWTLKESYVKARGSGLITVLNQFSFVVDGEAIRVEFHASMSDDAKRWRFALIDAPPEHLIAVGVDTGNTAISLRATHMVPLRSGGHSPLYADPGGGYAES